MPPKRITKRELAVWYGPQEIRDHFEGDDCDPTEGMCDHTLEVVGEYALCDDRTWETFHRVLVDAIDAVKGGT